MNRVNGGGGRRDGVCARGRRPGFIGSFVDGIVQGYRARYAENPNEESARVTSMGKREETFC